MSKVTFIGLGAMGTHMAQHCLQAGHQVTVYNRNTDKAAQWVESNGGSCAQSKQAAVVDADFVLTCIGDDQSLTDMYLGDSGVFAAMKKGAVAIDHTTASADMARQLHTNAVAAGVGFLDAPVSGGEVGAQNGALTVMVGGDTTVFEKAEPIITCFAKAVTLMGKAGSGQLTKMVNQICIAGIVQGLSEALAFSQNAGLDGARVLDVISKGAAQSWQMENRGLTMLDDQFDFGFAVDHMRKDLGMVLQEATSNGSRLPVTALVDQFYADLQVAGFGRTDTSSLIKRLKTT